MQLEKATLQVISSDEAAQPIGDPIPVQFNPSTLRLVISNSTEGGESRGRQVRQYTGSSSTTLSVDLIFDTADEGTTDAPVSVREKTAAVEQFVYPQVEGDNKQAPPKLRFQWGDLILEGVVESVTLDFDHFAATGVPLRAKVSFSFKEQDRRYEFLASGPGANRAGNAPLAGGFSAGVGLSLSAGLSVSAGLSLGVVGSVGVGLGVQAGVAIGGESAAEFAARAGLDPGAWRGLSLGGASPLSLEAGVEIGFSSGISASAGLGATVGAAAGSAVSVEGAFGLKPEAGMQTAAAAGANPELQQKFTVAAAGGVGAALESVKITRTAAAESQSRTAFQAPGGGPPPPARPALPEQPRTPLMQGGAAEPAPAPAPPRVDRRAASFGFGVPLRASVLGAEVSGDVPVSSDPTTPLWVALRAVDAGGPKSAQRRCRCGTSPCGHARR